MSRNAVHRRSFLARLAAGTAAFGAAFGAGAALPAEVGAAPVDELDDWFGSMRGMYKAFYDCASPSSAPDGVMYARNNIHFAATKLGTRDADNSVVVCFRHLATPYGYNDAAWAKYPQLAQMLGLKDPKTGQPATRNWLLHDLIENTPGINIPGIRARGAQFAVCGAATEHFAMLLGKEGGNAKQIEADLTASLIPGARMVAAGVVAVQRAQKAGFAYTYAG